MHLFSHKYLTDLFWELYSCWCCSCPSSMETQPDSQVNAEEMNTGFQSWHLITKLTGTEKQWAWWLRVHVHSVLPLEAVWMQDSQCDLTAGMDWHWSMSTVTTNSACIAQSLSSCLFSSPKGRVVSLLPLGWALGWKLSSVSSIPCFWWLQSQCASRSNLADSVQPVQPQCE